MLINEFGTAVFLACGIVAFLILTPLWVWSMCAAAKQADEMAAQERQARAREEARRCACIQEVERVIEGVPDRVRDRYQEMAA
jgi:hypothetical protein